MISTACTTEDHCFTRIALLDSTRRAWHRHAVQFLRDLLEQVASIQDGHAWLVGENGKKEWRPLDFAAVSALFEQEDSKKENTHEIKLFTDWERWAALVNNTDLTDSIGDPGKWTAGSNPYLAASFRKGSESRQEYLYVSASAWSSWPESSEFAPQTDRPDQAKRPPIPTSEVVTVLDDHYSPLVQTTLSVFGDRIAGSGPWYPFNEAHLHASQGARTPTFYYLVPEGDLPEEVELYFEEPWLSTISKLTNDILQAPDSRASTVGASIFDASQLTLYRMQSTRTGIFSNYVLLPVPRLETVQVENNMYQLVIALQRIEHLIAKRYSNTFQSQQILRSRLSEYTAIAREAGKLVDQLLLRVLEPSENPHRTRHLREMIGLIRRTLLQFENERDSLVRALDEKRAEHKSNRNEFSRQVRTELFSEREVREKPLVSDMLVSSQYAKLADEEFEVLRLHALETQTLPKLIESTSSIFQEEREKTLDALNKQTVRLNVLVTILAILSGTALFVNFTMQQPPSWVINVIYGAVAAGLLAFLITVGVRGYRSRSHKHQEKRATVSLRRLRERLIAFQERSSAIFSQEFQAGEATERDGEISRTLAAILDELASENEKLGLEVLKQAQDSQNISSPTRAYFDGSLELMVPRVELWCCEALLMAERPFPFEAPLPRTACLYHFRDGVQALSETEFRRVISDSLPDVDLSEIENFRMIGLEWAQNAPPGKLLPWIERGLKDLEKKAQAETDEASSAPVKQESAVPL